MSMRHTQEITKPRAGRPRNLIRFLAEARDFPLIAEQTTDVLSNCYRGSFPRGQNGGASNRQHPASAEIKNACRYACIPPHASASWRLTIWHLTATIWVVLHS